MVSSNWSPIFYDDGPPYVLRYGVPATHTTLKRRGKIPYLQLERCGSGMKEVIELRYVGAFLLIYTVIWHVVYKGWGGRRTIFIPEDSLTNHVRR